MNKPTSKARIVMDALVNRASKKLIDDMVDHRKITMKDQYEKDHRFTEKDIIDIDIAFLVQQIAGIQVLMRHELEDHPDSDVVIEEVTPDGTIIQDVDVEDIPKPKGDA